MLARATGEQCARDGRMFTNARAWARSSRSGAAADLATHPGMSSASAAAHAWAGGAAAASGALRPQRLRAVMSWRRAGGAGDDDEGPDDEEAFDFVPDASLVLPEWGRAGAPPPHEGGGGGVLIPPPTQLFSPKLAPQPSEDGDDYVLRGHAGRR